MSSNWLNFENSISIPIDPTQDPSGNPYVRSISSLLVLIVHLTKSNSSYHIFFSFHFFIYQDPKNPKIRSNFSRPKPHIFPLHLSPPRAHTTIVKNLSQNSISSSLFFTSPTAPPAFTCCYTDIRLLLQQIQYFLRPLLVQ